MKAAKREILLSFWKVHILHHAGEEPLHGQWFISELRRHGYEISAGTLYPLLKRMERAGWLKCRVESGGGPRARRDYRLTAEGGKVLALIREQIKELYREVVLGSERGVHAASAHKQLNLQTANKKFRSTRKVKRRKRRAPFE